MLIAAIYLTCGNVCQFTAPVSWNRVC